MAFTREMKTYPTLAGPKKKRKQHARRIARDRFRPPGGGTIQDMKNRVAALQLELAAALREAIRTGLRSDAFKVKRLVKYIPRDKTCQGFAVYRTIAALGARTPGIGDVDRPVKQATYERMIELVWIAVKKPHSYKATPLKRIYIPKPNGNLRPLSIPSYIDRAVQTLYNIVLDVFQEESADQRSFGFRRFRSPG
jgi:RNA-directed DNA polymerase